jgi:UDP-glucose 4-epimerase
VLVTGGAGFIGSHVVEALSAEGARVTILDNLSTGFREFVSQAPGVELVEGDLLDQSTVSRAVRGKDFVFHLAANADVKDGLLHPRKDIEQNILATQNLLEGMREHGVRRIAFASSGAVYGESELLPTPEHAPFPVQTSLYGASKVAAEGLLSAYAWGYGFDVWIFRFVSQLGPRYTHGHIVDFYRKLSHNPRELEVLGDGRQKKSYLHVQDCVAAMLLAIERSRSADRIHVYNIGHSDWIDVDSSLAIICRELGVTPDVRHTGGSRGWVGDAPKILLDTTKLRALGWAPTRSIEESIVETLRFLIDNPYTARRK